MKHIRFADLAVIFITMIIIAGMSFAIYGNSGEASQVRIEGSQQQWVYPLDQDAQINIPGPLGDTEVVISQGHVHVHDSACRNKVCVTTGIIHRVGQWIICLPNDVFIRIEGALDDTTEVDDVAF